jgi:DNA ligase-1
MKTFKPMLAATLLDVSTLSFPVMVSPKLDGLRCIIRDGIAVSRNLKPFRNTFVQMTLGGPALEGLDGELIVGEPTGGHVLNRTQSGIMSAEGAPKFMFHVFDNIHEHYRGFTDRFATLNGFRHPQVTIVPHYKMHTPEALLNFERETLAAGYEGVMIRGLTGTYKFGRATNSEHALFKFKRFRDGEAIVISVDEGTTNTNEFTRDALGRAKRSSHSDKLVNAGRVGTILAKELETEQVLNVSPGKMTHDMRKFFWENQALIKGRVITIKWFDYGVLDAPRFCTFQGFRDAE